MLIIQTTDMFTTANVADLMSCALQGATDWCSAAVGNNPSCNIDVAEFYEGNDWRIEFIYDDPNENEGSATGRKTIGPAELQAGVQKWADEYPTSFNDWCNDEADAGTGDTFLQMVVLGECVYG